MTRINVVPVRELCDQHLLAEHRELTRIPNGILSGKLKIHYDDRPSRYTLGAGHVKFFTDKMGWLVHRYIALHQECTARGFNVAMRWPEQAVPASDFLYIPTSTDKALNRSRILERWPKNARYYGKPITKP